MFSRAMKLSLLVLAMTPILSHAAKAQEISVEQRLQALEARQAQLELELRERDARIQQLESGRDGTAKSTIDSPAASSALPPLANESQLPAVAPAKSAPGTLEAPAQPSTWGTFEPGRGLVLARTELGEVSFAAFSYARYLNQGGLDDTYTDSFGRTKSLDLRNDLQLQKVNVTFKGWLFDPDFRYLFFTWTSNTSMGLGAQVVLGGNLSYRFNDAFTLAAGIGALPTTRSTNWTFPNWLRVDNRTMADDFFRGSYTSGIWASGQIAEGLKYRAMIGNNLSQLGVDAVQLDGDFNSMAGALWWMPTTGEYGPGEGFGDFEMHDEFATLFGVHYTRSREDAQSQPGVNSFENSQIRLSDGTLLFQADPFNVGTQVNRATYRMAAANGGFKYKGYSLDGEYYWRWVDDFDASGPLPVDELYDHGFQLQASAMLKPQSLQAYVSGSKIFGEYGEPWDAALGINWFPFQRREVRFNTQFLYMERSAIGYASSPYLVGGTGWVFTTDFVVAF